MRKNEDGRPSAVIYSFSEESARRARQPVRVAPTQTPVVVADRCWYHEEAVATAARPVVPAAG